MSSKFGPPGSRENLAAKNSSNDSVDRFLRFDDAAAVVVVGFAVVGVVLAASILFSVVA